MFVKKNSEILYCEPISGRFSINEILITLLRRIESAMLKANSVPTTVLHTKYFKEAFGDKEIQLIIPFRKRQFDKIGLDKQKNNCSFYTLYICWKMDL